MIEIIQHKVSDNMLVNPYIKMDELDININKELVNKDYCRLKQELSNPINKYDKANIKALMAYLEKLNKFIDNDNKFQMCWSTKDNLPRSYPIELVNEKAYGINVCNYIELEKDEKIVEIDLTELADIIAFEFMYRDLNETHDSIEEILKDCGIIGYESSELLTNFFKRNGDKVYELSKTLKIEDTPYYSYDDKKVYDYFNSKLFKTDSYRDVVDYSCRYANTIIASNFIKNAIKNNTGIKLVMLNGTNITFIVNAASVDKIKEELIDDISIRTFGRHFIVKPVIQVF